MGGWVGFVAVLAACLGLAASHDKSGKVFVSSGTSGRIPYGGAPFGDGVRRHLELLDRVSEQHRDSSGDDTELSVALARPSRALSDTMHTRQLRPLRVMLASLGRSGSTTLMHVLRAVADPHRSFVFAEPFFNYAGPADSNQARRVPPTFEELFSCHVFEHENHIRNIYWAYPCRQFPMFVKAKAFKACKETGLKQAMQTQLYRDCLLAQVRIIKTIRLHMPSVFGLGQAAASSDLPDPLTSSSNVVNNGSTDEFVRPASQTPLRRGAEADSLVVVKLTRHPFAVTRSQVVAGWWPRDSGVSDTSTPAEKMRVAGLHVCRQMLLLDRRIGALGAKVVTVRYEDMTTNLERTARQLCRDLGVEQPSAERLASVKAAVEKPFAMLRHGNSDWVAQKSDQHWERVLWSDPETAKVCDAAYKAFGYQRIDPHWKPARPQFLANWTRPPKAHIHKQKRQQRT
eukprot:m.315341 g.315341  ORF g.315341 m.315341 type:complete len:457 (-) comp19674_c5_seq2:56-1426(-)